MTPILDTFHGQLIAWSAALLTGGASLAQLNAVNSNASDLTLSAALGTGLVTMFGIAVKLYNENKTDRKDFSEKLEKIHSEHEANSQKREEKLMEIVAKNTEALNNNNRLTEEHNRYFREITQTAFNEKLKA